MPEKQEYGHREGSRWIDGRPDPDEFRDWFYKVKIHEGLHHEDYLPGIIAIENKERVNTTVLDEAGVPSIVELEQLAYAPYPKAETRIAYFWEWCRVNGYLGTIELEPAPPANNVPPGFFHLPIIDENQKVTSFLGVSYRIGAWHRDVRGGRGAPVIEPCAGTKTCAILKRSYTGIMYPDPDAVEKAQTGAIARALGFAGMLIVPGAGIATAEDMYELRAEPAAVAEPALPPVEPPPALAGQPGRDVAGLEELVAGLRDRLQSEFPDAYEEARAWAREKGYDLDEPPQPALRGLERQLRRKLTLAENKAAA